jgi:hypothetical protein
MKTTKEIVASIQVPPEGSAVPFEWDVPAKEILHLRRGSGGYNQGKGAGMKTPNETKSLYIRIRKKRKRFRASPQGWRTELEVPG